MGVCVDCERRPIDPSDGEFCAECGAWNRKHRASVVKGRYSNGRACYVPACGAYGCEWRGIGSADSEAGALHLAQHQHIDS